MTHRPSTFLVWIQLRDLKINDFFDFWTKFSIFGQMSDFWRNFRLFRQLFDFSTNFRSFDKFSFLAKFSIFPQVFGQFSINFRFFDKFSDFLRKYLSRAFKSVSQLVAVLSLLWFVEIYPDSIPTEVII